MKRPVKSGSRFIVFHRDCYAALADDILQAFDSLEKAVITGTPGIGKSHAFFSLLPRLLGEERIVGLESRYRKQILLFQQQSRVEGDAEVSEIAAFLIKDFENQQSILEGMMAQTDIVFRDFEDEPGRKISSLGINALEIMISSPRNSAFVRFVKLLPANGYLFLPPFDANEMVSFGRALQCPKEQLDDAVELMKWFGGVPRWCFDHAYDEIAWREFFGLFIEGEAKPIVELCKPAVANLRHLGRYDQQRFPQRLLYLVLHGGRSRTACRFVFSSKIVEELLLLSSYVEGRVFPLGHLATAGWQKSQEELHEYLCSLTLTSQPVHQEGNRLPKKTATFSFPSRSGKQTRVTTWTTSEIDADLKLPHRNKLLNALTQLPPPIWKDNEALLVAPPYYATWDALSTEALFNYTLGKKHDMAESGLKRAANLLGKQYEDLPCYWMVDSHTFEQGSFQIQQEGKYIEKIRHFLIPRPEFSLEEAQKIAPNYIQLRLANVISTKSSTWSQKLTNVVLDAFVPLTNELQESLLKKMEETMAKSKSESKKHKSD